MLNPNEIRSIEHDPISHLCKMLEDSAAELAKYIDELTQRREDTAGHITKLQDEIMRLDNEIDRSKEAYARIQSANRAMTGKEVPMQTVRGF